MTIDFDGTDDYVTCGSGATIDDIWDGGGSVAFWMKPDALPGDGVFDFLIGKSNAGTTAGWVLTIHDAAGAGSVDNVLEFFCTWATNDGDWRSPDEQFTSGVGLWTHIVLTYNSDSATNDPVMYINGASVTVTELVAPTGAARSSDAALNLQMGAAGATPLNFWNGKMDDVRMFTRILTANEAATLAAGYRGPLGGEALWLSCADYATVAHPDGTTLTTSHVMYDMSGNGNDGTPTNSPVARASDAPLMPSYVWYAGFDNGAVSASPPPAVPPSPPAPKVPVSYRTDLRARHRDFNVKALRRDVSLNARAKTLRLKDGMREVRS